MKSLYFDLETTGVDYWRHGIHQISGMIEVDDEIRTTFNFNVRPHEDAIIDQSALDVSGVTKEQIALYPPMTDVYGNLQSILNEYVDRYNARDKFFLIGYNNAHFDNQFLRNFFVLNGDKYFGSYFWANSIDVMILASEYMKNVRHEMENFKLHTVAKKLGIIIDETKLHDALYDIGITRQIYKIVTGVVPLQS